MRTRVKICGITQISDALAAVAAGADAIGLVFYEKSPRNVTIEQASEICRQMPAFVSKVALFVDASVETVNTTLSSVNIDVIQFHGSESNDFCRQFNRPFIKALHAKSEAFLDDEMAKFPHASALLVDTFVPDVLGGSGQTFDWDLLQRLPQRSPSQPLILAGGLTPDNVFDAICQVRPYAVDVSSGVELKKAIKDDNKLKTFLAQVMHADAQMIGK